MVREMTGTRQIQIMRFNSQRLNGGAGDAPHSQCHGIRSTMEFAVPWNSQQDRFQPLDSG